MTVKRHNKPETVFFDFSYNILDNPDCILDRYFAGKNYIIISDEIIWEKVGSFFDAFIMKKKQTECLILPGNPQPYADDRLVAAIYEKLVKSDKIPLAVGAGTINDVVKRAAFEAKRQYVCIPTAPSVDGFAAFGAAITVNGFKSTLECPAPLCILADERILTNAPADLIAAGYADLLAKLTGGADWILTDILEIEKIDTTCWQLVQPVAQSLLEQTQAIRKKEKTALADLYGGLIRSGLAMQRYKDSRPASGAEHLLSHTWEMLHIEKNSKPFLHGYKVALGTLISTAIYEELFSEQGAGQRALLERGFSPQKNLLELRISLLNTYLHGTEFYDAVSAVIRKKTPTEEILDHRTQQIQNSFGKMRKRLEKQLPQFTLLKKALTETGCPVEPADLGLSRELCIKSVKIASLIRTRYTVLDFAQETGLLDMIAEQVFSKRYFSQYSE